VFTALIERNSAIPTSHSQLFTTAIDNQSAVDIHVLQGERDFAIDNKTLGKFQLAGIPPAPRGVPRIEVTFDIDVNGIVNVSARDVATGVAQRVTVTANSEVDKMVEEAHHNRQQDHRKRDETETRNKAEAKVYQSQTLLKESKGLIPASTTLELSNAAKTIQDGLNRNDLPFVKRAMEGLDRAIANVSKAIYEAKVATGNTGMSYSPPQAATGHIGGIRADIVIRSILAQFWNRQRRGWTGNVRSACGRCRRDIAGRGVQRRVRLIRTCLHGQSSHPSSRCDDTFPTAGRGTRVDIALTMNPGVYHPSLPDSREGRPFGRGGFRKTSALFSAS
jgi:hypothetical protein